MKAVPLKKQSKKELLYDCGVTSLYSLVDENTSVEEAMTNAGEVYYRAAVP